jgi:broad specificity polyphosphatase/5'/3'-nucleotidase SurE
VTSTRYGIDAIAVPLFWAGAQPDLVVAGPNVGSNLFLTVQISGTVGAAVYASRRGIPAIAFSGASTGNLAWNTTPVPARSTIYAQLAGILVQKLLASGNGTLPQGAWLNVNFPEVTSPCTSVDKFRWVLSRINPGLLSAKDVTTCGTDRLPTEDDVLGTDGCYIAVSVGDAADKTTADATHQADVLKRIGSMLTCLPA